jgi:hypothetical protein
MMTSQSSRPDRIAAMYSVLYCFGAISIEKLRQVQIRRWISGLIIFMLLFGTIVAMPISTPILNPPLLKKYLSTIGFSINIEKGKMNEPIPQWLADRLGWRELAGEVGKVYHALSTEEQKNTVIVSTNYGEAGALELYGAEFGLPKVYATHNSYHLWGPPPDSIKTYIVVYANPTELANLFETVDEAGARICEDCSKPQQKVQIYLARNPKIIISKEWKKFKIFN